MDQHPLKQDQTQQEFSKFAFVGNVDSGKSTLVGVLTKGECDDGRGSARLKVFNFQHEKNNGKTSSVAQEIMGFDADHNQVIPDRFNPNKNKYWKDVVEHSRKVVTLIDLCGHETYLKTTIFGLVSMAPDYATIIVGANMGVPKMTREHLGLCLFLKIPFIIVLTKVDIAPKNVYDETLDTIKSLVKSPQLRRTPLLFDENTSFEDIDKWAAVLHGNQVTPIFSVSCVTGQGLKQLKRLIAVVNNRTSINKAFQSKNDAIQFDIHENFNVTGVGRVVSGLMRAGTATIGQTLLLGPYQNKEFKMVTIKAIHVNRVPVQEATIGQNVCFAIKPTKAGDKLERADFRKGMVLLDQSIKHEPVREFEANIHVLHHSTTMSLGYQAIMHCGVVRQAVEIKAIKGKDQIINNDTALVRFRFVYSPEFVKINETMLIREGRTKIFGYITSIISEKQLELESTTKEETKQFT